MVPTRYTHPLLVSKKEPHTPTNNNWQRLPPILPSSLSSFSSKTKKKPTFSLHFHMIVSHAHNNITPYVQHSLTFNHNNYYKLLQTSQPNTCQPSEHPPLSKSFVSLLSLFEPTPQSVTHITLKFDVTTT